MRIHLRKSPTNTCYLIEHTGSVMSIRNQLQGKSKISKVDVILVIVLYHMAKIQEIRKIRMGYI